MSETLGSEFEGTPFKEPLLNSESVPSEFQHKIKELKNQPDKLVREYYIDLTHLDEDGVWSQNIEKSIEKFKKGRVIFKDFIDQYGLHAPDYEAVLGKNEKGTPVLFLIVDKIEGQDLNSIEVLPKEALEEFDMLFEATFKYYLSIYKEGGDFWSEFANRQIIYGHKHHEEENHPYIVDVEPRYYTYDKSLSGNRYKYEKQSEYFFEKIELICRDLFKVEQKLGTQLQKARSALVDLISSISKKEPNYFIIKDLKRYAELFPRKRFW